MSGLNLAQGSDSFLAEALGSNLFLLPGENPGGKGCLE